MKIPYVNLRKQYLEEKNQLISKIKKVLNSGEYVGGDEVKKFEKKISKLVGNPALSEISNLKIYKYKQALAPKMANKIWLDLSTIGLILLITGYANKPKLSPKARCICLAS